VPGTPLYNGTRWFWVNAGERIDILCDWISLDALNEKFYIDSPPRQPRVQSPARSEPHFFTHFALGGHGGILHVGGDPMFYLHHANIDRLLGKLEPAGNTNPTDPKFVDRKFAYGDRSSKRCGSGGRLGDRTAQLGYEYDRYEKPPQPKHLTPGGAAERARTYETLHEQALGGPSARPHTSAHFWREIAMIPQIPITLLLVMVQSYRLIVT
jgi:hypothetical protein